MKRFLWILLISGLWMPAFATPARAEEEKAPVKITLYPAAEPRPALKYQFVVPVRDRRPGNAAVLYNRIPAERNVLFGGPIEYWRKLYRWQEAPLAELRTEEVRSQMRGLQGVVDDLHTAALFETVDWQHPIHYQMFWTMPLPEIQSSRNYARLLAPYIRWQIAEGRYDDAVDSLRSGYALARNVGKGDSLVQSLVGIAIAGMMNKQLEEFIQQPDAPSLYWAMQSLSRPLVDLRPAMEAEMDAVYLSFPDLRDLNKKHLSSAEWQALLKKTQEELRPLISDSRLKPGVEQLRATGAVLDDYPVAKQSLIDRGRTAAEVEAMPVAQVILLDAMEVYEEARDEMFKWYQLPYAEARKVMARAGEYTLERQRRRRAALPLAWAWLPAVLSVKMAEARLDRDYAALEVLDALRLHAAGHGGRLPDSLSDITEVPVPTDPFNAQPFVYHREGNTAVLESYAPIDLYILRYRIQMLSKGKTP